MDSNDPWAPASPRLAPTCGTEKLPLPLPRVPHMLTNGPSYCGSTLLWTPLKSFLLYTVSCPITYSELQSLDIRDLEARVQQLLFQTPFGWLRSPCLHPDFTLENTVQYFPLIIYSSWLWSSFDYVFMVLMSVLLAEGKMAVIEMFKWSLHTHKQPYHIKDF